MIFTGSDYLFALAVMISLMVLTSPAFAHQKLGAPRGRGSRHRAALWLIFSENLER
jgi:hypothetical protein